MIPGVMAAQSVASPNVPPTTARYWRIYITENNGDAYTSIQEVELRGTLGGADLTTPSTVTSQSSFFEVYDASKLVDNIMDYIFNTWITGTGIVAPHWASLDFGTPTQVQELAVWPQAYTGGPPRAPKAFIVQTSTDGVTWADKKTFSNVTGWVEGTPKLFDLT
jgi:hypothetical protein